VLTHDRSRQSEPRQGHDAKVTRLVASLHGEGSEGFTPARQAEVFHQTNAISLNGALVLEIETPVNKFDLVRINDQYGRRGKDYEDKKFYDWEKDLTLTDENNIKIINNTKLEIISYDNTKHQNLYHDSSLFAILDQSEACGMIQSISNLDDSYNNLKLLMISEISYD